MNDDGCAFLCVVTDAMPTRPHAKYVTLCVREQVSLILNDAGLFEEWKRDIRTMAGRIIEMRKELHRLLTEELKTPGNWDHIVKQIGMFRCVAGCSYRVVGLCYRRHARRALALGCRRWRRSSGGYMP